MKWYHISKKNMGQFSTDIIYKNIDLYYYINNDNLEYDFILSKGANHKNISISFQGLDYIEINEDENIVLSVGDVKALLLK